MGRIGYGSPATRISKRIHRAARLRSASYPTTGQTDCLRKSSAQSQPPSPQGLENPPMARLSFSLFRCALDPPASS